MPLAPNAAPRVDDHSVVLFARQFSALLSGGVSITRALEVLSEQAENAEFAQVVEVCAKTVSNGSRLSSSLNMFPTVFPRVFVTMIAIGEESGQLVAIMAQLANWLEHDRTQRQKVRSALTYPTFVLIFASILCLLLFYKVMPGFVSIFTDMGIELPLLTRLVMAATLAVRSLWFWALGMFLLTAAYRGYQKLTSSLAGRAQVYRLFTSLPVVGVLLNSSACSRYCASLELMLNSGMKFMTVFQLAAQSCGNPLIEQDAPRLAKSIGAGELVSDHFGDHSEIYGITTTALMRAGEESSTIPLMMKQAAYYYDLDTSVRIDSLSASLEPLLLAGVGVLVAIILLSLFLPMYSYLDKMGM